MNITQILPVKDNVMAQENAIYINSYIPKNSYVKIKHFIYKLYHDDSLGKHQIMMGPLVRKEVTLEDVNNMTILDGSQINVGTVSVRIIIKKYGLNIDTIILKRDELTEKIRKFLIEKNIIIHDRQILLYYLDSGISLSLEIRILGEGNIIELIEGNNGVVII